MRAIAEHPLLARGMAAGEISESWAAEIAAWLKKLPEELRDGTEEILAEAAAAGASLEDLATITAAALAQWEADHPDEDDEGGFPDRYLQVETTFGGAGVIRGDLTPECAAAVTAVLEALGKKAGPEDDRSEPQRFHDALQLACELLLRAKLVPDRAGADTQVVANISLRDLRAMPGASGLEDVWIRALLGEGGYLTGADAEAAACDAMIVPVVAGTMDATVLDQMIDLVLGAFGHHARPGTAGPRPRPSEAADPPAGPGPRRLAADAESAFAASSPTAASAFSALSGPGRPRCRPRRGRRCGTRSPGWPSTWSPGPPGSPRSCAAACSSTPGTPRRCRWTSATPRASRPPSGARSCGATGTSAPGPAAAARPHGATCTT